MDRALIPEILRQVRRIEIQTNRNVDDTLAGQYQSTFKGRGMDFDSVREYVPGDEVRAFDWNVTARTGRPHVKSFREERELTLMLVMDVSASGEFGSGAQSKRETMAELGSALAFSALRNGDKVGLILFAEDVELYIPPGKGRSHLLRIIREILFFQPQGKGTDAVGAIEFTSKVMKRHGMVFLVSDFCLPGDFDESLEELRRKLRVTGRRHDTIAVSIDDPRERELPDVGLLSIEDSETGEQVEIDTRDPVLRAAYGDEMARRHAALRRTLAGAGCDQLGVTAGEPYLPALLSFFDARRRR